MGSLSAWLTEISDRAVDILTLFHSDCSGAYCELINDILINSWKLMLYNGAIPEDKINEAVSGWIKALKDIGEYKELSFKVEDLIYYTKETLMKHTECVNIPALLEVTLTTLGGTKFQYIGENSIGHNIESYCEIRLSPWLTACGYVDKDRAYWGYKWNNIAAQDLMSFSAST
ncbi:uncharacterized protein PV09_09819 [Verruconis gallopava]|uniref:Uncharacterized protein n=1 Tax=Verruconis gallopava TaxID=253628 RepID=A0A0D1X8K2_9PEZI|nr:uncharacterized protein PV09_09819 [Verruconis gallopava]KIV98340.1 hypothetical protein PV09_09819 [Verruconis gallopava]